MALLFVVLALTALSLASGKGHHHRYEPHPLSDEMIERVNRLGTTWKVTI